MDTWNPLIPHVEKLVRCICGATYCANCSSSCPKCGSVHLKDAPPHFYCKEWEYSKEV